jgi:hypothetical protein
MRDKLVIIVTKVRGVEAFHFTSGKLQPGDIWFPVVNGDLFSSVENVMNLNGLAHNVTSLKVKIEGVTYKDVEVEFNKPSPVI